jgi:hypothetical protein
VSFLIHFGFGGRTTSIGLVNSLRESIFLVNLAIVVSLLLIEICINDLSTLIESISSYNPLIQ